MRKFIRIAGVVVSILFILSFYVFFHIIGENDVFMIIIAILIISYVILVMGYEITSPTVKIKATITKRPGVFIGAVEYITFLLPNGEKVQLWTYGGKYLSMKVGDLVTIKYKGTNLKSMNKIKKDSSNLQVEKMRASFNKMTPAQKTVFIKNLTQKLKDSNSVELKGFLSECITQYNLEIRNRT